MKQDEKNQLLYPDCRQVPRRAEARGRIMKNIFLIYIIILSSVSSFAQTIYTVAGGGSSLADGVPAVSENIGYFAGVALDASGNFYIADGNHNKVRKVDIMTGIISTVAGTGTAGFAGDSGLAISALLNGPTWISTDASNNLFITDGANHRIRKVEASTGIITTVAGYGPSVFNGDSILAISAAIDPQKAVVDHFGNLYIADNGNQRVRKVDTFGFITTIAGKGIIGYSGDSGPADSAEIVSCYGLAVDTSGNVYIADLTNDRIRRVDHATNIITTIAGNGTVGYSGDSILASASMLNPYDLIFDPSGNLYVADYHNSRIRMINATTDTIVTVAGNGTYGYSGDSSSATLAALNRPEGVAIDGCGNLYIADYGNRRVRKVNLPSPAMTFTNVITSIPGDTICLGASVTYFDSVVGGSVTTSYGYQWYVNDSMITATSNSYTYTPGDGDSIRCVVTGSNTCNSTSVSSNTVYMTVLPTSTPTITLSASATAAIGSIVTVNATVVGAGSSYTINWYNGGSLFNTTTTPSVTYTKAAGIDHITATIVPTSVGCYDSATSAIFTVTPASTGVGNLTMEQQKVYIYPNPVTVVLTISSSNKITEITIVNLLGQTVQNETLNAEKAEISVASLPLGVYFIKITDSEGQKTVRKIVKQ